MPHAKGERPTSSITMRLFAANLCRCHTRTVAEAVVDVLRAIADTVAAAMLGTAFATHHDIMLLHVFIDFCGKRRREQQEQCAPSPDVARCRHWRVR